MANIDPRSQRMKLYQELEKDRGSKVLCFVTGERRGMETQIAQDCIDPFVDLLDAIGPTKKSHWFCIRSVVRH